MAACRPEERKMDGRLLRLNHRNVHKFDSQRGAGGGSILRGPPFVVRPVQTERSLRLNAKHIAALDASRLPGKFPDFE